MFRKFYLFVMLILLTAACSPENALVVNGEPVRMETYKRVFSMHRDTHGNKSTPQEQIKETALEDLIRRTLMLSEATKRGLSISAEELDERMTKLQGESSEGAFIKKLNTKGVSYETYKEEIRDELMIEKLKRSMAGIDDVSYDEVKRLYDEQHLGVISPAAYSYRGFLIDNQQQARKVAKEVRALGSEAVSNKYAGQRGVFSINVNGAPEDKLTQAEKRELSALAAGDCSSLFEDRDVYALVCLRSKTPEKREPFDRMKMKIMGRLIAELREDRLEAWLSKAREAASVEVFVK